MAVAIPTEAFPLSWPVGVPRTSWRVDAPFGRRGRAGDLQMRSRTEVGSSSDDLYREVKLLRPRTIVISSNLPTRSDGLPYASAGLRGNDPGVCVYWSREERRAGRTMLVPYCMPCDKWKRVADNLHALALSIGALRGMERWGAVKLEQAFAGFAALPPGSDQTVNAAPPAARPWREVLGGTWPTDLEVAAVLAIAKSRHRALLQQHHPDRGGDGAIAAEINAAMEQAERELAGATS